MGNNTSRKPNLLIRTVDRIRDLVAVHHLFSSFVQSRAAWMALQTPAKMMFNRWNRELTFEG